MKNAEMFACRASSRVQTWAKQPLFRVGASLIREILHGTSFKLTRNSRTIFFATHLISLQLITSFHAQNGFLHFLTYRINSQGADKSSM